MKSLGTRTALLIAGCLSLAGVLSMLAPKRYFIQASWPTRLMISLFGDNGPAFAMFLIAFALCVFALVNWVSNHSIKSGEKP